MADHEGNRLQELRRYAILDTPPELRFDRITSLAARLFRVPISHISLVDEHRQWFKSRYGLETTETPREISFCTHAIQGDQVMVVPDATRDARFQGSPLVTGDPHIRFYAAAPLISPGGFKLGTLCLVDRVPREALNPDQTAILADLAALVVDELELRLAEKERRAAERLFTSVYETAAVGISVTGEDGRFALVNPAFCRLAGYSAEELLGRHFGLVFDEDEREAVARAHTAFVAGAAPMPEEWHWRTKDGRRLDVLLTAALMVTEGRRFRVTTITDLTRIRQAEAALRDSHQRLARTLESITDGFFTLDRQWRFTYLNPEAERLLGGGAISKSLADAFRQTESTKFQRMYRQAMEQQAPVHFEEFSPGLNAWFEVHAYPSPDLLSVYFRDITQRKSSEEALSHLAAIIEFSDDAIIGRTLDGVITSWNAGAERLYGYSAGEMIGRNLFPLEPADSPDDLAELYERLRRGERIAPFEAERVRKDGARIHVSLTTSPIKDAQGNMTGVSSIARDITGRKQLEEQLQHSQKMEAVALLAGGVAHDFNNLLTVIIGWGRMLLLEVEPDSSYREYAEEILHSAERAAALTSQLLAFSRRQITQPRVLDLNEIVGRMHKMLQRILGENIQLRTGLGAGLGSVRADPGQVEQVIVNLAVNARDAMPRGGTLTIETGNVELEESEARQHAGVRAGSYVMLAITDTGVGMRADVQQHIFEPFYTTKEKGKGTGLGLSIIHGIVKQNGGEIWVYSEPDKGSRFTIYLPRVAGTQEPKEAGAAAAVLPRGLETILLVEDEGPVQKMVRQVLRRQGYRVLEAGDGARAVELAGAHSGAIDLLLTDVVMPRMAGPDLARAVKMLRPEIKVVFMSGYADSSVEQHLTEPHADFLQKPFTPELLAQRVREALDGKKN